MKSILFVPYYTDSKNFLLTGEDKLSLADRTDLTELNYFMSAIFNLNPLTFFPVDSVDLNTNYSYNFKDSLKFHDRNSYNVTKLLSKVKINDITTVDCVRILLTDQNTYGIKDKQLMNNKLENIDIVKHVTDFKEDIYIIKVNEELAEYLFLNNTRDGRYKVFKLIMKKIKEKDTTDNILKSDLFLKQISLFKEKIKYDRSLKTVNNDLIYNIKEQ